MHILLSLPFCQQVCCIVMDARCPRRFSRLPSLHTRNSTGVGCMYLTHARLERDFNPLLKRPSPAVRRSLFFMAISFLTFLLRRHKWRTQLVSTMMECVYFFHGVDTQLLRLVLRSVLERPPNGFILFSLCCPVGERTKKYGSWPAGNMARYKENKIQLCDTHKHSSSSRWTNS